MNASSSPGRFSLALGGPKAREKSPGDEFGVNDFSKILRKGKYRERLRGIENNFKIQEEVFSQVWLSDFFTRPDGTP